MLASQGNKLKMGIDEVAVGYNDGKQEIGIGGGDQTSQRADVTIVRHGHQCRRQQQQLLP